MNNTPKRSLIYLADISAERARIARELHDGIAQDLAAIGYALDSEIGRSDTNINSRKSLREIRQKITELNHKVRAEIYRLRSEIGIDSNASLLALLTSLPIDFTIEGSLPESELGIELFKALQELIRNCIEHGHATHIAIDILPQKIELKNNGESTRAQESETESGFGLIGIAERLAGINWEIVYHAEFTDVELRRCI